MSNKSKDELRKLQEEKIEKKFKLILSALEEKEREMEKNIETLEEKLIVKRFEEKIRTKQNAIVQLALKKDELEKTLKEPENKSVLRQESGKQTEKTNAFPIIARLPRLRARDSEAIRKAAKEPEKKRLWKFFS